MDDLSEQEAKARTDIAALSAAVVAVVVSMFISPGDYSIMNLVVSLTLFLIIIGYVWNSVRRFIQSAAVGAVIGLALMPGIGFVDETVRSERPIDYLLGSHEGAQKSGVPNRDLVLGWLAFATLALAADRAYQRRKKPN